MRIVCALLLTAAAVSAQQVPAPAAQPASWLEPQAPLRVFGNVYYVGSRGLSAILITSPQGHVLLDAPMAANAPMIVANIRALGYRVEDVRLIGNSHAHFDHAGAIAAIQRASGARVAARAATAPVFKTGAAHRGDPQFGLHTPMASVKNVRVVRDGETMRVGPIAITAHATGGHTPGGTSWSWRSCLEGRCLDVVYADSLTAVSADSFRFTDSKDYPTAVADFEKGFSTLSTLSCDVLLTPHPEASDFWKRIDAREAGTAEALVDRDACRRYAEAARVGLERRLAREKAAR